jgi:hypothetical protein
MTDITPSDTQACAIAAEDPDCEIWRPVVGFSEYEVSNRGRVRRTTDKGRWRSGHILRPGQAYSGHLYVMLTDEFGRAKKQFVHRLVATTFVGPAPYQDALVLHHDDDPAHNTPANLYWGDRVQNVRDARLNRKRPEYSQRGAQSGESNHAAVLTAQDVQAIRRYLNLGLCGSCIARLFNVKKETIYSIAKGRAWRELPDEMLPLLIDLNLVSPEGAYFYAEMDES